MTSREEALRALEKAVELVAKATPGPWKQVGSTHSYGIGGDFRPGAFSLVAGGTSGKDCDAVLAAVNFIREHGPAILATASEQAPVGYDDGTGRVRDWSSPAHTSEARDAEVAELIEATRRLTADIEFRIDDPRSQLLDRARRATTAAVGCNCPGSAKVSYLSHAPNCPAREALGKFAAMHQEAGDV